MGTCSWIGRVPELARKFYRTPNPSPEQMLRYYSNVFPTVEVDSTFYALPTLQNCQRWADRTPADFVFHIKAFSIFTTHRTTTKSLPTDIRRELPPSLQSKPRLNSNEVPEPVRNELWRRYKESLQPLQQADKLGFVLLQFAPWFGPTRQNTDYILSCKDQLTGIRVAVEFRNKEWFEGRLLDRTPEFLRENQLSLVCVDMPQGFDSSIPPLAEATAEESYVRFHGRNAANWKRGGAPNNIHDYRYTEQELKQWLVRIRQLEENTSRVYVMFNTVQALDTAQLMQNMLKIDSASEVP